MSDPPLPLDGLTSYSKIFSIANPDKYAIYDSRVSAALNAVQLLYSNPKCQKTCFNYIRGQNRKISGKGGFMEVFTRQRLAEMGWQLIPHDNTYRTYLDFLKALSKKRREALYHFEMTMFANAERLCDKAMQLDREP